MRILVTGARGMVGRAVVNHWISLGDHVEAFDHKSLDITNEPRIQAQFDQSSPEVVVNCAAWTDVDGCELDPERNYEINARSVERLAQASRRAGALFITLSTDYVFDGAKDGFYTQRDDPQPASAYGLAKLEGERRAMAASARTIIARTGWVFGPGGRNFLSTVLERARREQHLKAISDAYGTPTFSQDLSIRLRELAVMDLPGIFHLTNSGDGASFEQFARTAIEIAGVGSCDVEGVLLDSLKRPAPRPRNSRLYCILSEALGLAPLPNWLDALRAFAGPASQR